MMISAAQIFNKMTTEEYLAEGETQEIRHEYIDVEIIEKMGGTVTHGRIYSYSD